MPETSTDRSREYAQQQLDRWSLQHALLMLPAGLLALYWGESRILVAAGLLSFIRYFYLHRAAWRPLGKLGGPANVVTAARLLLMFVTGIIYIWLPDWAIVVLTTVAISADGLDGYFARRYDCASRFGAVFDMETDAYYVMLMTVMISHAGITGTWIGALGLIRYVYVLIVALLPPAAKERNTRSLFGRIVAVVLMISLIACFVLPPYLCTVMMLVVAGLVGLSFARSFFLLLRS